MKKLFVFLIGMCFYLPFAEAQTQTIPFARHYWLNPHGVNYTLAKSSYRVSTTEKWVVAAARNEKEVTSKNTIALFGLDNLYNIERERVIGLPSTDPDERFYPNVEFEVHCITQSFTDENYIICGSMRKDDEPQK